MGDLSQPPLSLPWPRTRLVIAWVLALSAGAVALEYAHNRVFAEPNRNDGNSGHTTIDFGGQWIMGRMIIEGQGRHLYQRDTIQAVLERAYPHADEDPKQDQSDARRLMDWMARGDWEIAPPSLGGPLYPPVQGLLCVPLGLLPPRTAYHFVQVLNLVLVFVLGWMAERLTAGRVWWPVASLLLMLLPGYAGAINLGQNSVVSLFLLTLGWWQMVQKRPVFGGILWGFLAFKPVWALAFFPVTLLTGRWRMALGMAATGLALVVLTLPFAGLQAWFDWVKVGRLATAGYARNENWIILSRDLQGAVRRCFMSDPDAVRPTLLALGLWLSVAANSVIVVLWRRGAVRANFGPGAAFVLLGAWLSCFHFMYYDTILAALPLLLLFASPGGKKAEPFAIVLLLIAAHYISTGVDPSFHFPPFDTLLLLELWWWCGWQVLARTTMRPHNPGRKWCQA